MTTSVYFLSPLWRALKRPRNFGLALMLCCGIICGAQWGMGYIAGRDVKVAFQISLRAIDDRGHPVAGAQVLEVGADGSAVPLGVTDSFGDWEQTSHRRRDQVLTFLVEKAPVTHLVVGGPQAIHGKKVIELGVVGEHGAKRTGQAIHVRSTVKLKVGGVADEREDGPRKQERPMRDVKTTRRS